MTFETVTFDATERIATITLNRPDRLNTIVPHRCRMSSRRRSIEPRWIPR
jgi:enoyl-CoA hydratase/carnithine racemase